MQADRKKLALLLLVIILIAALIGFFWKVSKRDTDSGSASSGELDFYDDGRPPVTQEELDARTFQNSITLPAGKLVITQGRYDYVSESLRLVIPKLSLDVPVQGDTTLETLKKGPGLYKYSQLPGDTNSNVSIAAHRDLDGCEFYYMDTVGEGDHIYLVYEDKIYRYEYRSTTIVEATDWDPIRVFYDNRVTLTTCDPIGTSLRRMIVVGELVEIVNYTENYSFA